MYMEAWSFTVKEEAQCDGQVYCKISHGSTCAIAWRPGASKSAGLASKFW